MNCAGPRQPQPEQEARPGPTCLRRQRPAETLTGEPICDRAAVLRSPGRNTEPLPPALGTSGVLAQSLWSCRLWGPWDQGCPLTTKDSDPAPCSVRSSSLLTKYHRARSHTPRLCKEVDKGQAPATPPRQAQTTGAPGSSPLLPAGPRSQHGLLGGWLQTHGMPSPDQNRSLLPSITAQAPPHPTQLNLVPGGHVFSPRTSADILTQNESS